MGNVFAMIDQAGNLQPFLAADIGGTHARLALVQAASHGRSVELLAFHKYDCTNYDRLGDFIADFLARHVRTKVDRGVIAGAGYAPEDGKIITANLRWLLSIRETQERLGFVDLRLVNDFKAVANAVAALPALVTTRIAGDAIAVAVRDDGDTPAGKTLDAFRAFLCSVAGDMVLACSAVSIRLAGGFLSRIRERLVGSRCAERFLDKGAMRTALGQVPVHPVEHGQLGIVNATHWYLE